MSPTAAPKDEWEYKGHEAVWGPNGGNELHIDGEDVTGDLLGKPYTRDIVRQYIEEEYETGPSIGNGTMGDYPGGDE